MRKFRIRWTWVVFIAAFLLGLVTLYIFRPNLVRKFWEMILTIAYPSRQQVWKWTSSTLFLISLYISVQSFFRRFPPSPQIISYFYVWFRVRISDAIGLFLFNRTLSGVFLGGVISVVVLAVAGTDPIVIVTGLYATTLFLYHLFEIDVPELVIRDGRSSSDKPPEELGANADQVKIKSVDVENLGKVVAKDIDLTYKLFDEYFYPETKWRRAHDIKNKRISLDPEEDITEIDLHLVPTEDFQESPYYLAVRADPGGYFGLFGRIKIIEMNS